MFIITIAVIDEVHVIDTDDDVVVGSDGNIVLDVCYSLY